jgi:hypothetical protein
MRNTRSYFSLGQVVMTRGALDTLNYPDILPALARHATGDWGNVGSSDWSENDWSVANGERVLSSYKDRNGMKFWIITERDRSATTVLLPEDY